MVLVLCALDYVDYLRFHRELRDVKKLISRNFAKLSAGAAGLTLRQVSRAPCLFLGQIRTVCWVAIFNFFARFAVTDELFAVTMRACTQLQSKCRNANDSEMRSIFMLLQKPADAVLNLFDFVHFAFEAYERDRLGCVFGAADEALLKPLFGLVRHIFVKKTATISLCCFEIC